MATNDDAQGRMYQGDPEYSQAPTADNRPTHGSRGKITTRPSRESILRSYASQDEMRARDARLRSQQTSRSVAASAAQRDAERRARQEALAAQQREQEAYRAAASQTSASYAAPKATPRRTRVVPPLSSQESYDQTRSSRESYERARASRDALSESRRGRALNREVIDGRGSIDSRTFNESQQISSYVRNDDDRHDPAIDTVTSHNAWHSRAGQGFVTPLDASAVGRNARRGSHGGVGFSGVMSGSADYSSRGGRGGFPLFLKIAIPLIVVLLAIIVFLVFFR